MGATVAGVDGCKGGWYVVLLDLESGSVEGRFAPSFASVLELAGDAEAVGVDIPIGLLDHARPGGRLCDVFARTLHHPELSFRAMSGGATLTLPKHTPEGRTARLELLVRHGFAPLIARLFATRPEGGEPDDILDACAVCWTARRVAEGSAERIPPEPHADARGLRMEIWY
jgi:predicted RNase H-like nuclease